MESGILDRFGRKMALAPYSLYKTPSQQPGNFRPWAQPRAKTYEAITSWQRREMVDVSRVIAAGVSTIDAALIQAGEFSIGDSWHIKYAGTNKRWGKRRDEWFNTIFARNCSTRGDVSDWRSSLRQINWTRKVEADYGIVFDGVERTLSDGKVIEPTGKFSPIKYDRISTGLIGGWQGVMVVSVGNGLDECKELPKTWNYFSGASGWSSWPGLYIINDDRSIFDGQRIIDGIIIDENMNVIGYRIVGFSASGLPVYCDIAKEQMHFNYSARKQLDMIRGIPEIAEAIIPLMHLDDIQNLMEIAIKIASCLAIARESTDGRPMSGGRSNFEEEEFVSDPNGCPITDSSGRPIRQTKARAVEELFPGLFELSTNNKEKLTTLPFDRPTRNEEEFIKRIEKALLHKMWPRDLIYAEDTGRAGTRAIASQANSICTWDQMCTERTARWIADRATEFAMRRGDVPNNDNLADPYDYIFTVPGKFTVDEGNDSKMQLQSLGRCTISRGQISEMSGYLAEEIEEQREVEEDRLAAIAERLNSKHNWMSEKEWLLRLDNGGNNISFADNAEQDEGDEEDISTETKPSPKEAKSADNKTKKNEPERKTD